MSDKHDWLADIKGLLAVKDHPTKRQVTLAWNKAERRLSEIETAEDNGEDYAVPLERYQGALEWICLLARAVEAGRNFKHGSGEHLVNEVESLCAQLAAAESARTRAEADCERLRAGMEALAAAVVTARDFITGAISYTLDAACKTGDKDDIIGNCEAALAALKGAPDGDS